MQTFPIGKADNLRDECSGFFIFLCGASLPPSNFNRFVPLTNYRPFGSGRRRKKKSIFKLLPAVGVQPTKSYYRVLKRGGNERDPFNINL
jgi:hypothetical protein